MEISLLGALAVAASTAFGGAVAASEWRLMAYNHSFVTVLERDGLRAAGDVRDGWVAYGLADPADGLDYFMTRYEWNCSSGTSRAIHTVGYLGSQVVYEEAGTGEVTIVVPDTDEAIVLRAVCDGVDPAPSHLGWASVRDVVANYRDTLPPS